MKKEKSKLIRFLSNPLFGSISAIVTIASVILVIIFYLGGISKRELIYYCHPVKATVVKAGQTSSLDVFCNNEKIKSDITAVQVAIWNHGKKSIKKDDILEPITLYTEPKTPIIDAIIRKQTREVINLSIDRNSFKEGFMPISWRILEYNDGGIIQVIFAGGPDVEILAKGTIEGQQSIKQTKYSGTISTPEKQMEIEISGYRFSAFTFLFMAIFFIFYLFIIKKRLKKTLRIETFRKEELHVKRVQIHNKIVNIMISKVIPLLFIVLSLVLFMILLLHSITIRPPFGF